MHKYCWITGASKGIGKATAKSFVKRGFQVLATSRSNNDLLKLKKECEYMSLEGKIIPLPFDVTNLKQLKKNIDYIVNDIEKLDIIVFNAGTYIREVSSNLSFDKSKLMIDLNFNSIINTVILLNPYFLKLKVSQIVAVSSIAGWRGMPESAIYSASKSALRTVMESFSLDFSNKNIKFRIVSPGFIDTPLTRKNTFKMPFLMSSEKAGEKIYKFIVFSNNFETSFPWMFAIIMKIITLLPWKLYKILMNNKI